MHERGLEVDLVFLEQGQLVALLDQAAGEEAVLVTPSFSLTIRTPFLSWTLSTSGWPSSRLAASVRRSATAMFRTMSVRTCFITSTTVAVDQQLAVLDDADLVADVGQLGQDVAGDQDRLAHVAQLLEQAAHLDAGPRVEAAGRLVEQQHLRLVQQHAGQAEPLRHAARQARDQGVALVAEVDQLEHLLADLLAAPGP